MKKLVFTLCGVIIAFFAIAQQLAQNVNHNNGLSFDEAAFSWAATEHQFGKIKVGTPVSHEFTFDNTGTAPLVISSVQASCGCTVTAYSKEPIEAGGKGFVKATYDAAKVGQFSKTVSVNANTEDGVVQLTIKGEVVK